jgi:hypothetical protein
MWCAFDLSRVGAVLGNNYRIAEGVTLKDPFQLGDVVRTFPGVRHSSHREENDNGVIRELIHGILLPKGCEIDTNRILEELLRQWEEDQPEYLKGMCHAVFDIEDLVSGKTFQCQLYRSRRSYIRLTMDTKRRSGWQSIGGVLRRVFGITPQKAS